MFATFTNSDNGESMLRNRQVLQKASNILIAHQFKELLFSHNFMHMIEYGIPEDVSTIMNLRKS
jgi:hypothetical protein